MHSIVVRGEAKAFLEIGDADDDWIDIPGEELSGVTCDQKFAEYLYDDLANIGLSGGVMRFEFTEGQLWTITTYEAEFRLTEDQLRALAQWTEFQWIDGIGEEFEQFPCRSSSAGNYYISPSDPQQTVTIRQDNAPITVR
ncbi:MAG: hypothetical protein JWL77_1443 [Chthonomonadaceae bacterium]|nr:hypothetical protein [Chthonomonadaceae bacterium]